MEREWSVELLTLRAIKIKRLSYGCKFWKEENIEKQRGKAIAKWDSAYWKCRCNHQDHWNKTESRTKERVRRKADERDSFSEQGEPEIPWNPTRCFTCGLPPSTGHCISCQCWHARCIAPRVYKYDLACNLLHYAGTLQIALVYVSKLAWVRTIRCLTSVKPSHGGHYQGR